MIHESWPADVGDLCGNVFGMALRAAQPDIPPTATVLEVGCAEFDWLSKAAKAWPQMTLTGIDWRAIKSPPPERVTRLQGDVMALHLQSESLDWVVGISSIEHIGLGHYKQDPVDPDGDSKTMALAYQWLKPGGWMYLDVPWNSGADAYHVHRASHRVYDDATVTSRLLLGLNWSVKQYGAVHCRHTATFETQPKRLRGGEEFYYLMLWIQKGSHAATP